MSESYRDMSLDLASSEADMSGPRPPPLRVIDPDTNLRGRPKTAPERLKHHLSVYERVVDGLSPADVKQMIELAHAILQDAKDLAEEALAARSRMVANIFGLDPKAVTTEAVNEIALAIAPAAPGAAGAEADGRTISLAAIRRRLEGERLKP